MKSKLFILIFSLGIISCGDNVNDPLRSKDPAKVRAAIKEKMNAITKLSAEKEALEKWLAKIDKSVKADKKIDVTVKKLSIKDFGSYVEVQGSVLTANDPGMASSETGGRIKQLLVKKDGFVNKGDLIAKVDLESLKKSIQEIETSLNLAKDIFERQEKLWKQNIGSEVQYLQSKNQVEQLTKSKERLEFEITKANVYAPVSGHIENIIVKEGEICGPGMPIVQIVNSSALKVVAQVPENFLGKVKNGDIVEISYPAIEQNQNGRVSKISRMINPNNRTFDIEATIDSKGGLIKPNLMATLLIQDYSKPKAIVIEDNLIMQDVEGNHYVMLMENDKAMKRIITIGKSYQNQTVVESGLDGNETIIVKGARQVVDGDKLTILGEETNNENIKK